MKFLPAISSDSMPTTQQLLLNRAQRTLGALALAGSICLLHACSKPAPEPTATPTPTPAPTVVPSTPTPAPTSTPAPTPPPPRYTGTQQMEYIQTANNAFIELRGVKAEAYAVANKAYSDAGGVSAKGLTSKAAIADRRAMIDKIQQANEDYLVFVNTQNETYKAELAKTPLTTEDADSLVTDFATKSKFNEVKKLRESARDLWKTGDEMLVFLDKTYGSWTVDGTRPKFKKPGDQNQFAALGKKFNDLVTTVNKLQSEANAPLPTPGASPIPSVAPSPGANVAPSATVASPAKAQ